jgi:hypothetical protein
MRLRHRLWGFSGTAGAPASDQKKWGRGAMEEYLNANEKVQCAIFRSDIRAQALIGYFSNTPAHLLD